MTPNDERIANIKRFAEHVSRKAVAPKERKFADDLLFLLDAFPAMREELEGLRVKSALDNESLKMGWGTIDKLKAELEKVKGENERLKKVEADFAQAIKESGHYREQKARAEKAEARLEPGFIQGQLADLCASEAALRVENDNLRAENERLDKLNLKLQLNLDTKLAIYDPTARLEDVQAENERLVKSLNENCEQGLKNAAAFVAMKTRAETAEAELTAARPLIEVSAERKRQDEKWGIQNHGPDGWLAILAEEVGEVARAILEGRSFDYGKELTQVAAVAIAALECLGRGNLEIGSLVKAQEELKRLRVEETKT